MTTRAKAATRTLLVTVQGGRKAYEAEQFKITIPADAKVTFAGTNPSHPAGSVATLRIYESANAQLAVFTNVVEFRDLALPLERLVVETEVDTKRVAKIDFDSSQTVAKSNPRWVKA